METKEIKDVSTSTLENNKLIAEFMGLKTGKELGCDRWQNDWFDNSVIINGQRNERLFFNVSWDWLMPVVEKIESLNFVVQIHLGSCFIKSQEQFIAFKGKYIAKSQGKIKLDATYQTVIEFIKWYNLNK